MLFMQISAIFEIALAFFAVYGIYSAAVTVFELVMKRKRKRKEADGKSKRY